MHNYSHHHYYNNRSERVSEHEVNWININPCNALQSAMLVWGCKLCQIRRGRRRMSVNLSTFVRCFNKLFCRNALWIIDWKYGVEWAQTHASIESEKMQENMCIIVHINLSNEVSWAVDACKIMQSYLSVLKHIFTSSSITYKPPIFFPYRTLSLSFSFLWDIRLSLLSLLLEGMFFLPLFLLA